MIRGEHQLIFFSQLKSEVIQESPVSTVSRTFTAIGRGEPQWLAAKSATIVRKFSKEPHDIKKELRILSSISHPNVCRYQTHEIHSY